jgi:hypothetical protein
MSMTSHRVSVKAGRPALGGPNEIPARRDLTFVHGPPHDVDHNTA